MVTSVFPAGTSIQKVAQNNYLGKFAKFNPHIFSMINSKPDTIGYNSHNVEKTIEEYDLSKVSASRIVFFSAEKDKFAPPDSVHKTRMALNGI